MAVNEDGKEGKEDPERGSGTAHFQFHISSQRKHLLSPSWSPPSPTDTPSHGLHHTQQKGERVGAGSGVGRRALPLASCVTSDESLNLSGP